MTSFFGNALDSLIDNLRARGAKRSLDAGKQTGPNKHFAPRMESADKTWSRSNPKTIIGRSRDLSVNHPVVVTARRRKKNNTVRTGINPQFRFHRAGDPYQLDKAGNRAWKLAYNRWAKRSSSTGKGSINQQQRLMFDSWFIDGEAYAHRVYDYSRKGVCPLRLQLFGRDHIDTGMDGDLTNGNVAKRGFEYTKGQLVALHVFQKNPSDCVGIQQSIRVPASEIIHLYDPELIGQTVGLPCGVSVIMPANDLGDYQYYNMQTAKAQTTEVAYLYQSEPGQNWGSPPGRGFPANSNTADWPVTWDGDTEPQEMQIGSAVYRTVPAGAKIETPDVTKPGAMYTDFTASNIRNISLPLGMSYEMVSGDYTKTTFSGANSGKIDSATDFACTQATFAESFLDGVMGWFIDAMWLFDLAPTSLPGYLDDPEYWTEQIRYQFPRQQSNNRFVSLKASILAIDNNLSTASDEAAAEGRDFYEIIDGRKEELILEQEVLLIKLKNKKIQDEIDGKQA